MVGKKYIQIIVLLLLTIAPISAQIGLKGGPVLTDIIFEVEGQIPYLGYETNSLRHKLPNLTYQFGIFKYFKLSDNFDFQPELLIANKGLNYGAKFLYDDIKYLIKINYLEIPLLLKYNLTNQKSNQFSFLGGPYFSYAINNTRLVKVDNISENEKMKNINSFDWGLAAGISYSFSIYNNQFIVDYRLSLGFVDIMEFIDEYIPEYYGPKKEKARNVDNALTIGYLLRFGN